ncbi:MAG: alpha-L-arabinofuranosidase [Candidatus Dadabacteria bacterium]
MKDHNSFLLTCILTIICCIVLSCNKAPVSPSGGGNGTDTSGTTPVTPVDPPVENTIGFFLDNWAPKNFTIPSYIDTTAPVTPANVFVTVDASTIITKVPTSIAGQNANVWMTQMVTEVPLMNHLRNLKPNVIRFPGGSLSDVYLWNAPKGQKPPDAPDSLVDANGAKTPSGFWFGKNTESWTMSVDNYYNMLQQTGNEGMITVNYGYARYGTSANPVATAAHLAADWVRYDNGRTKYWEIGNECNGTWEAGFRIDPTKNKDGQPAIITGALYGQHVKVFVDSMKKAAQEIGKTIYIGAYILEKEPDTWQNSTDKQWNYGVLTNIANKPDFYIIHSYYTPYQTNATADVILNTATTNTISMINYVKTSISNAGAIIKPIALTEWNITSQGSMQQVSFINGMHAAILLGEAIKNKYGETSRWDLANGWSSGNDHGLFNIGDEPGISKWNPRPTFYYMYYFQKMIGDRLLSSSAIGNIISYPSSFSSGEKGVILVNTSTNPQTVLVSFEHWKPGSRYYWYTLTGGTDNGEFSRKVFVNGHGPTEISGGPAAEYSSLKPYSTNTTGGIKVSMPARSVAYMIIDK